MEIFWAQGLLAGFIATVVMTISLYAGKIMGLSTNVIHGIGLMVVESDEPRVVYGVGLVTHFVMGSLFGLVYVILFALVGAVTLPAMAAWGLFFGMLHYLTVGAVLGVLPALHPRVGVGEVLAPPGFFGRNAGGVAMPLGLMILHLIFGAMVAVVYGSFTV